MMRSSVNPQSAMHNPQSPPPRRVPLTTHHSLFHAYWHLFRLSLRRQFFSRQTLVCLGATAIVGLIAVAWTMGRSPSVRTFAQEFVIPVHVSILLPVYAICYGASGISSEREDRTLVYLLITPLQRPLIYLTKSLSAISLVLAWTALSLFGLWALAGPRVRDAFSGLRVMLQMRALDEPGDAAATHWGLESLGLFWPAIVLGALAYTTLYLALGAAFRRGTIVSLVYTFFLEWLLGNMPGIVKRISVLFYVSCTIFDAGSESRVSPMMPREMFLPISGHAATTVLALLAAALLALGLAIFTGREYRDLS